MPPVTDTRPLGPHPPLQNSDDDRHCAVQHNSARSFPYAAKAARNKTILARLVGLGAATVLAGSLAAKGVFCVV